MVKGDFLRRDELTLLTTVTKASSHSSVWRQTVAKPYRQQLQHSAFFDGCLLPVLSAADDPICVPLLGRTQQPTALILRCLSGLARNFRMFYM